MIEQASPMLPETPRSPAPLGLADRLRMETRSAHGEAERVAMAYLFHPTVLTRRRYAIYLCGLHAIYQALESQLDRYRRHPVLGAIYFPELKRTSRLASDLAHLDHGSASPAAPTAAAIAYKNHLHVVAEENPLGLIAHIYTRYLGDLSGGQMLKNMIRRTLQLESEDSVASLLFPEIADLGAFKTMFRARLNALPLSPKEVEAVSAEACTAFSLTRALFESLALPQLGS